MNLSMEQVRILRQDGSPLELRIVPSGEGFQGQSFFRVEVEGREPFEIETHQKIDSLSREMGDIFRFYPHEVRINGQPVHREPPPDLAEVFTTQFTGEEQRAHSFRKYNLEDPTDTRQKDSPLGNAVAGGVICLLWDLREEGKKSYHSELPGPFQHRRALMKVEVRPIYILDNEEMDAITGDGQHTTKERPADTPAKTKAKRGILEKAEAQVERTMAHRNIPPVYDGPIFRYLLTGDGPGTYFENGAPMAVHGTPVTMYDPEGSNAAKVAAAETLYRSDHALVPIQGGPETEGSKPILEFRFEHTPLENQEAAWCMEKVQDITLVVRVEDGEDQRVQADFAMDGNSEYEKHVMFVPGRITQEELSDCMVRGYWDEENCASWDEVKYEMENMQNEFLDLTLAAMKDPEAAFRKQLQKAADSFTSDIPTPDQPITVTSRNGQIVMTASPG